MRNRAFSATGKHRFRVATQLCNSLLHNWHFGINREVGRL
jgi:hypothetical protein